jgi:hypothetical protein
MELVVGNLRLSETLAQVKSAVRALSERYDRSPQLYQWLAERRRMKRNTCKSCVLVHNSY